MLRAGSLPAAAPQRRACTLLAIANEVIEQGRDARRTSAGQNKNPRGGMPAGAISPIAFRQLHHLCIEVKSRRKKNAAALPDE